MHIRKQREPVRDGLSAAAGHEQAMGELCRKDEEIEALLDEAGAIVAELRQTVTRAAARIRRTQNGSWPRQEGAP